MLDPITDPPCCDGGIFGEPGSRIAVLPAAAVVKSLWEIPMIEANPRLDIAR